MDAIVSAALEEICARGTGGIPLPDLWSALRGALAASGLPSSNSVNKALWCRLLSVPGLRFEASGSTRLGARDPSIQSLEDAEKLGLSIVAEEHLRDNFVGLYDRKASVNEIPEVQRRALERLAAARTNGITQNELAKEFGIKGNNIFYTVKNLESQQLIVRQSTIVRAKESGTNNSIVNTNLLHLYRYAKNKSLNSQQRIEITRPDFLENLGIADGISENGDGASGEPIKDDVRIKDYLPAMRAVCEKLEEANGKVLVISDIKVSLGYTKTPGHRNWRNILNRLKDASLVEEFQAKIKDKAVSCLRLLKKFDPKDFQAKPTTFRYAGFDSEQITKHGRRGQITDQLLELPIEHRIYDMVDAEGPKGITISEVYNRLGLNAKKIYTRLIGMCSRFGMHLQAEIHNRTQLYRVWTFKNYQIYSTNIFSENCEAISDRNEFSTVSKDLISCNQSSQDIGLLGSCSADDTFPSQKICDRIESETSRICSRPNGDSQVILSGTASQNLVGEWRNTDDVDVGSARRMTKSNIVSSDGKVSIASTSSENQTLKWHHRAASTVIGAQREQRILKRLKNETFILTVELYRWLEGFEKDKPTTMARKTLDRTLNKLQQEGLCKCVQISIPVVTNFRRTRITEVILHPSVGTLSSELLDQIYKRQRRFDVQSREGSCRSKNNQPVTVLTGLKKSSNRVDDKPVILEAMRTNGFVSAKMVRAKLLHNFLWSYMNSLPDFHNAVNSKEDGCHLPQSTRYFFALDEAIKVMPLQLFLQVVGSTKAIDSMVEHCRLGSRLLDLCVDEYKLLMDTYATGRLSSIIDILLRLKLIQLVRGGLPQDANMLPHTVLTHAMELKPYIEEPLPRGFPSLNVNGFDRHPRIRHDFVLSKQDVVDVYWETLEYCYVAADPETGSHAFPGSAVHEVFHPRSWTSVRIMTSDQRTELLKRVKDHVKKKMSSKECVKIAKELNVTVEQVLRVHYDKCHFRLHTYLRGSEEKEQEKHVHAKKRKRSRSLKHGRVDAATRESSSPILSTSDYDEQNIGTAITSLRNVDDEHHEHGDDAHANSAVETEQHKENCENHTFISQCAFPNKLKPVRQQRFLWNENLERELVLQYARHLATLGARYYRVDWSSLSDLPAPPGACRRRMAFLKSDKNIRKSVLRLCNLLGERYSRYLGETCQTQEKEFSSHHSVSSSQSLGAKETSTQSLSSAEENAYISNSQQYCWDDFEDLNIKMAVDEVFRYKKMAKLEHIKRIGSRDGKEWPDISPTKGTVLKSQEHEHNKVLNSDPGVETSKNFEGQSEKAKNISKIGRRKSGSPYHRMRFPNLLSRRGVCMERQVPDSLAVANAIELLKLMFLSTSSAPEVQTSLTTMLRLYAECDLFAAFNYLKDKDFMVIRDGSRPFVLSQKFWQSATSSPFPIDSGKRASTFSDWLQKQEKELMESGVVLPSDLQCGEIFRLFAFVASRELLISPCLPKEGIGEADEPNCSKTPSPIEDISEAEEPKRLKRKYEHGKMGGFDKIKKHRSHGKMDADFCSRREKGFPGIKVLLNRSNISTDSFAECLTDKETLGYSLSYEEKIQQNPYSTGEAAGVPSLLSYLSSNDSIDSNGHLAISHKESSWDAMSKYATHLSKSLIVMNTFSPEVFKSVNSAIQGAGDQGLNMEQISEVMNKQGLHLAEIVAHTLEAFQLAIKVNAYDSVRIVDSSYRSKYLLTMLTDCDQDKNRIFFMNYQQLLREKHYNIWNPQEDATLDICNGHTATICGLHNEPLLSQIELQPTEGNAMFPKCNQCEAVAAQANEAGFEKYLAESVHVSRPILPWINGDGSLNNVVYKGLARRVLGSIMQNPGILQEEIIHRMDALNPQTCRQLLESLVLDNHITVRMLRQATAAPPAILQSLLGSKFRKSEPEFRKHYFANPMCTDLL